MALTLSDDTVKTLWSAVKRSRKHLESQLKSRWDRNLDLYRGKHWWDPDELTSGAPDGGGIKEVVINWTGAGIAIKWTSDTAQPPRFEANPRESTDDPFLRPLLSEYISRHFVGAGGGWSATQAARLDMLIFGTGLVGVGWRPGIEEPQPTDTPEAITAGQDAQAQFNTLASNPGVDAGDLEGPDVTDTFAITGETGIAYRISPYDAIVPVEARWDNWQQEAAFMGRVYVTTMAKLEAAGYDTADLTGTDKFSTTQQGFILDPAYGDLKSDDEGTRYVVMAEVWFRAVDVKKSFTEFDGAMDREYGPGTYPVRVLWAVSAPEAPLLVETWPYDLRDDQQGRVFPIIAAFNREIPGEFFGMGDPQIGENQQEAMNLAESLRMTHLDKVREKYLAPKGLFDEDAIAALESNDTPIVVEIEHPNPSQVILPLERSNIAGEYENAILAAKEDHNALTGVTDAARGNPVPGDQTATEARLINQLSSGRSAKDSSKFEELLCWVAGALWQLKCQFASEGDSVTFRLPRRLPGQPQQQTQILGREMLVPIDLALKTGATRVSDQLQKLQRMMGFAELVTANNQWATLMNPTGHVDIEFFLEEFAQASDFTADLDRLFDTSAVQQQAAQMQQQMALISALGGGGHPVAGSPGLGGSSGAPPQSRGVPSPTGAPFPLLPNGSSGPSNGV